jgi:hypothetical protein
MKKTIFLILSTGLVASLYGQSKDEKNKKESNSLVHVLDWGERILFMGADPFDETKDEIISQIGKSEFAEFEKFCTISAWPRAMKFLKKGYKDSTEKRLNTKKDSIEKAQQIAKLNTLKMYKIATYKHIYGGKNWGNLVILKVPYNENASWDTTSKWNTVYFILKESAVKEIK